ncbi:MAG: recombinase family protein [Chloroflexota bacterium]
MKPERNRWVNFVAVSSGQQAEKESPKEQERENQKVIESYGGICVAVIRIEESRNIIRYDEAIGRNGAKGVEGYRQLDEIIADKKADFVVLRSMDRLARTTALSTTIQSLCEKAKITIYCRNSRPSDHEMETGKRDYLKQSIEAIFAEEENRRRSERIQVGQRARVESGHFLSVLPYGYEYKYSQDGERRVEIVEHEAENLRYIFQSILDGLSVNKTLLHVRARGIMHRNGPWQEITLRSTLSKIRTYAGYSQMTTGDGEHIEAVGHHEPIISEETADRVTAELKKRTGFGHGVSVDTLFTQCLICGECGKKLNSVGKVARTLSYPDDYPTRRVYKCKKYKHNRDEKYWGGCKKTSVYTEYVLEHVKKAIEKVVDGGAIEQFMEELEDGNEGGVDELGEAEEELAKCKSRRSNIAEMRMEGVIEMEDYTRMYKRVNNDIKKLEERISTLSSERKSLESPSERLERLRQQIIDEPIELAKRDGVRFNAWLRETVHFVIKDREIIEYIYQ